MLEQLTVGDFGGHLNAPFPILLETGERLDLELIEARSLGEPGGSPRREPGRPPFSLIFRGPIDRLLPQRVYTVEHPTRGSLGIFLVPLGPEGDPKGLHYQAVFN